MTFQNIAATLGIIASLYSTPTIVAKQSVMAAQITASGQIVNADNAEYQRQSISVYQSIENKIMLSGMNYEDYAKHCIDTEPGYPTYIEFINKHSLEEMTGCAPHPAIARTLILAYEKRNGSMSLNKMNSFAEVHHEKARIDCAEAMIIASAVLRDDYLPLGLILFKENIDHEQIGDSIPKKNRSLSISLQRKRKIWIHRQYHNKKTNVYNT